MLEIFNDSSRKIIMKNSKKYKHKKSEISQKRGNSTTYSKGDSRPFLHCFLRTNYFKLITGLNIQKPDKLIRSLLLLIQLESVGWLPYEIGIKCIGVEKSSLDNFAVKTSGFFILEEYSLLKTHVKNLHTD